MEFFSSHKFDEMTVKMPSREENEHIHKKKKETTLHSSPHLIEKSTIHHENSTFFG